MDRIFAGHVTLFHTSALLPWTCFFIEKGFKTKRSSFFLISGLVLGLQMLAGYPQNTFYSALFLTVYFFIRYFSIPQSLRIKPFHRLGVYYFLIPAVAFGVSAIQILPSLEFMPLSDRAKNTYEFATFMSFPPQNFFTFLVPKPHTALLDTNWEFGGYLGVLSILLAGIGAVFSKPRQYTWCFGIIIFIAITIMLGHYTPVYHLYYKWLPIISTFRVPARCMFILVFSIAVLVGFGVQHLCESPLTRKQHGVVMVGLTIISLCLFGGAKVFKIPLASKEMLLAIGLTVSALVILNLIRFLKNRRIIAALIIAALFIDLYLIYTPQIPRLNKSEFLKKHDYERIFEKDPGYYRVNVPHFVPSGLSLRGMKFHYYVVNAYTTIVLNDYYKFIHSMANLPKLKFRRHTLNPQLFKPNLVFSSKILGIKYAVVQTETGYRLTEADQVMPRAVLVKDAIILPRLEEHLDYIKRPDFDPQKQVLLLQAAAHNSMPPLSEAERMPGKDDVVRIIQYYPNRIELKSVSNNNSYLVLSELFYPGWYAYVDGREVPILRANYLLRAIPLTAGQHDIVFVYAPMSFFVGAAISVFTLLLLGGVYLRYYRKKGNRSA
jgi:uncharacterized membrane protein YfhO